ncbi:MAG: RHS repeat-associated core domain-containing protein [Victivallales bacterium]|nr:RHS repeat-associated core domain-containing protein [Victivallales bacterium]
MRKLLLAIVFAACVCLAGLRERLHGLQEDMALRPGWGIGRSVAQLQEEEQGNPMELAEALRGMCLGLESRACQGRIELSTRQRAEWVPVSWNDWCEMLGGEVEAACPFAWLGVKTPVVPAMQSKQSAAGAYDWIDLFPGLCGTRQLNPKFRECVKDSRAQQLCRLIAAGAYIDEVDLVEELLKYFYLKYDEKEMFIRKPAVFPGYANTEGLTLRPVKVLERTVKESPIAQVKIELRGDKGEVLLAFTDEQRALTGEDMKLRWNEKGVPELLAEGNVVATGRASGYERLKLRCNRIVDNVDSDVLECSVPAKGELALAMSSGSSVQIATEDEKIAFAKHVRTLQDRAATVVAAAFSVMDRRQLFATAGTQALEAVTPAYVPLKNSGNVSLYGLGVIAAIVDEEMSGITEAFDPKGLFPVLLLCAKMYSEMQETPEILDDEVAEIISCAVGRLRNCPVILDFSLPGTCISVTSVECSFELSNARSWTLDVSDADGKVIAAYTGENETDVFDVPIESDGWHTFKLTAWDEATCISQARRALVDGTAPVVELNVSPVSKGNGFVVGIEANVVEDYLQECEVLLYNSAGELLFVKSAEEKTLDLKVAVPTAGEYEVRLVARDKCGNASELARNVRIEKVSDEGNVPDVALSIANLNEVRRLVSMPFEAVVRIAGMSQVEYVEMYLDGWLVSRQKGALFLKYTFDTENFEQGLHRVQAVAYDGIGSAYYSNEQEIYYTTLEEDGIGPAIEVRLGQFPLQTGGTFTVICHDAGGLFKVEVYQGGKLLAGKTFEEGTCTGEISAKIASLEELRIVATDVTGNVSRRVIELRDGGNDPKLNIISTAFGESEYEGDAAVIAIAEENVGCMVLELNGVEYARAYYPEDGCAVFTLSEEDLAEGRNVVWCRATSIDGIHASDAHNYVHTPVLRNVKIAPELVAPYLGTGAEVSFTAEMRLARDWSVAIEGTDVRCTGNGRNIEAKLDTTGLADGDYIVAVTLPELDYVRKFNIMIDAKPGEVLAHIEYPAEGGIVDEGVLRVIGSASAEEKVFYGFELFDANGQLLGLENVPCQEEWRLRTFPLQNESMPQMQWKAGPVSEAILAAFDLSGLPDGLYRLCLYVRSEDGECASSSVAFNLASQLKCGVFSFSETDLTVSLGGIQLKWGREYSTLNSTERGKLGFAWKSTTMMEQPVMEESRMPLETEDGGDLSVHCGGSRDICVTLADGSKRNFVFSLEAGGGYSFCYYARWISPDSGVSLEPNCSNKLMSLPGLEPYWEAAGPATPWEMFDFPSFTMRDSEGLCYRIEREALGTAYVPNGGDFGYVEAYGDLKIAEITWPNGYGLAFDNGQITMSEPEGALDEMLRFEEKEGSVASVLGMDKPVRLDYEYDNKDNLSKVLRSVNGGEPVLHRQYEYALQNFPHHVTAIKDGDGSVLARIEYDKAGRVLRCVNAEGVSSSSTSDVFSGEEMQTDALGRETFLRFDANGKVLSRTLPNGAMHKYGYDEFGNEISYVSPVGETLQRNYDGDGRMISLKEAGRSEVRYEYSGGKCTRIVEGDAVTSYGYDGNGRLARVVQPNDDVRMFSYNADGLLLERSLNGEFKVHYQYDKAGNPLSMTSDLGVRYENSLDEAGRVVGRSMFMYHPVTGEEIRADSVWEYDEAGQCIYAQDAEGNWCRKVYASNGKCAEYRDNFGNSSSSRYDMSGLLVETVLNGRLVKRYGYDAAGQCVFSAELAEFDTLDDVLVFPRAYRYAYDEVGNRISTEILYDAKVSVSATGRDAYKAELLSFGKRQAGEMAEYDLGGRIKRRIAPDGTAVKYDYDEGGRISGITDSFGRKSSRSFDGNGRLASLGNPAGGVSFPEYDAYGTLCGIKLPDGSVWRNVNDRNGRPLERIKPDGASTLYRRNAMGQLTSVSMPELNGKRSTFAYSYDDVGAMNEMRNPLGGISIRENDQHGRRVKQRLPDGSECSYEYNGALPYPSAYSDFMGNRFEYNYGGMGALLSKNVFLHGETKEVKKYMYSRDMMGRLLSCSVEENGEKRSSEYAYDVDGRLAREVLDGLSIERGYDAQGRLSSLAAGDVHFDYSYSSKAPEIGISARIANGMSENYTIKMDAFDMPCEYRALSGRLRKVKRSSSGQLLEIEELDAQGQALCRIEYAYDACGRKSSCIETWSDGFERRREWSYDAWSRLMREVSSSSEADLCYTMEFGYDENGNTLWRSIGGTAGEMRQGFAYDVNDRMISARTSSNSETHEMELLWDANGRLLEILEDGVSKCRFTWDAEGLLRRVHTGEGEVEYSYDARGILCRRVKSDAEGNRVAKDIVYSKHGEHGFAALAAMDGVWLIGEGGLLGGIGRKDSITYYGDGAGSIIATRDNGGTLRHVAYDARGRILLGGDKMDLQPGFCGELQDAASGLLYLRSRFYMPELGMFISPDTAEGDLEQPQSLNKYAYCCNDPVNNIDPQGTSMAALSYLGIGLSLACVGYGYAPFVARKLYMHAYCIAWAHQLSIERKQKEHDNVTLIVHGVGVHRFGYSEEDMAPLLEENTGNQDIFEMLWGGFAVYFMHVPNPNEHYLALATLRDDMEVLKNRGYLKRNLISHSWGTVLCKDYILTSMAPKGVGLWATMGSPLPHAGCWLGSTFNYDDFAVPTVYAYADEWLNFYCPTDPVIYLRICGPNASDVMPLALPLFSTGGIEQHSVGSEHVWSHSCYWTHPDVIGRISHSLQRQK